MLVTLMMLALFSACRNPSAFTGDRAVLTSAGSVVENLVNSYNEKDLEAYLNSFSDTSRFYDEGTYLWDIEQERRLHEAMFTTATKINLAMQPLESKFVGDNSVQAVYRYQLRLQIPDMHILNGEGEAVLEFLRTKANTWKVKSFREIEIGLRKKVAPVTMPGDSLDYFPLQVGNAWTYEEQFAPNIPDIELVITDSLMLQGNFYHQVQNGEGLLYSNFVRMDSMHQLRPFFTDDSSEQIVFNFAAEVGDSLIFTQPNAPFITVVELISHKDSLSVPAGTFQNLLEFLITDFNSGSRFVYEFAPNVGIIRQRGTNQVLALKSALVNGKKYPVITSVETSYASWTQIKSSFR